MLQSFVAVASSASSMRTRSPVARSTSESRATTRSSATCRDQITHAERAAHGQARRRCRRSSPSSSRRSRRASPRASGWPGQIARARRLDVRGREPDSKLGGVPSDDSGQITRSSTEPCASPTERLPAERRPDRIAGPARRDALRRHPPLPVSGRGGDARGDIEASHTKLRRAEAIIAHLAGTRSTSSRARSRANLQAIYLFCRRHLNEARVERDPDKVERGRRAARRAARSLGHDLPIECQPPTLPTSALARASPSASSSCAVAQGRFEELIQIAAERAGDRRDAPRRAAAGARAALERALLTAGAHDDRAAARPRGSAARAAPHRARAPRRARLPPLGWRRRAGARRRERLTKPSRLRSRPTRGGR